MSKYVESRFLPSSFEIHWLSIINSFVLVLLLTAFLTIILLRVLKNDFSRYMELDDDAMEEEEVRTRRRYDFRKIRNDSCVSPHFIDSLDGSLFMVMSFASRKLQASFVPPSGLETS